MQPKLAAIPNAHAPAFPTCDDAGSGLTKREWFAGQALASIDMNQFDVQRATRASKFAVEIADAIMAELERTKHAAK